MRRHSVCSSLQLHACSQSLACCIDSSLSVLSPRGLRAFPVSFGLGDMMNSLAFKLTALHVVPSWKLKSAENGPTMKERRPTRLSTLTGSCGQSSTSLCQSLMACFFPVASLVPREIESVAMVSFRTVEQMVHSRCSGTSHAHWSKSNLCPFRSFFHVPGAKNSALQRSQIMVSAIYKVVVRRLV